MILLHRTDIIESTFGYFKNCKSPNRMYEVPAFVMTLPLPLPLYTKLSTLESARNFDFKDALKRAHRKELKDWKKIFLNTLQLNNPRSFVI